MDFRASAETTALLGKLRAFLRARLLPREAHMLATPFREIEGELAALRAEARAEGLWGPQLPRSLGGLGLTLVEHGLVSEVLGQTPFGHYVFGCQAPDAGNIEILERYGTAEQKTRWLEPLAKGEIRSCFSMTEPDNPGSNPTELSCTARVVDGDYVIDGRKWFTSSADGARFAIVMAVTDERAPPHRRATMILVPTDTRGFRLVRNVPVMGHVGAGYTSHGEVVYEACRVPRANRLGDEGAGFVIAQERLGPGRIHHCMRWLGICERAFRLMGERMLERRIAPGRVLADEPLAQAMLAECRARIDAARLAVLETAWTIDAIGFQAARAKVSLIKFHTADVLLHVLDRAIQMYGAAGLTDATPLSHYYAHERGARIYDGPDEVHKLAAGRALLKELRDERGRGESGPPA
jgi:alkylation response protein AidB-like acyl-CoA dehydrogenase